MADAEGTSRPVVLRDEGPASSGGASSTQRVVIEKPGVGEIPVHVKFAKDVAGALIAENERALAAELIAGRLAKLINAPVPEVELVELPAGVDVRLRNDRRPAPGLAVASHTVDPWTDVNAGDSLADVPASDLAALAVFHAWAEVGDRGHNMIRSRGRVHSVDHVTALASGWNGGDPSGAFTPDPLLATTVPGHPEELRDAAQRLAVVSDEAIDEVIDGVPGELIPSKVVRGRLKQNIKRSRDLVSRTVLAAYPDRGGGRE